MKAQDGLRRSVDARWVPGHQLHFTLKFLGDTAPDRLPQAREALARATAGLRAFELTLAGLGCFPNPRSPRVLWAGCGDGAGVLQTLAARVEEAFAEAGFPREARPFAPHLTLGRVREDKGRPRSKGLDLPRLLENARGSVWGKEPVSEARLMESKLTSEGARHTPLFVARLSA